jgi:hypothetical protein
VDGRKPRTRTADGGVSDELLPWTLRRPRSARCAPRGPYGEQHQRGDHRADQRDRRHGHPTDRHKHVAQTLRVMSPAGKGPPAAYSTMSSPCGAPKRTFREAVTQPSVAAAGDSAPSCIRRCSRAPPARRALPLRRTRPDRPGGVPVRTVRPGHRAPASSEDTGLSRTSSTRKRFDCCPVQPLPRSPGLAPPAHAPAPSR